MQTGQPYTIEIVDPDTIMRNNILVGNIWLCSGQSNMDMPVDGRGRITWHEGIIARAAASNVRLFNVPRNMEKFPDCTLNGGNWEITDSLSVEKFSTAWYLFGKESWEFQDIPVGIIVSAWGCSNIEARMSQETLERFPGLSDQIIEVKRSTDRFEPSNFDGIASFSKVIDIPGNWVGIESPLIPSVTDDYDWARVNGTRIGKNAPKSHLSSYTIPSDQVKSGTWFLTVYAVDFSGRGGIWGNALDLDIRISDSERLSSGGNWDFKVLPGTENIEQSRTDLTFTRGRQHCLTA